MKRGIAIGLIVAGVLLLGVGGWRSGWVRGAVAAVIDHARGHPASYSIGCTSNWPRDPREFREWELYARDYNMAFITIGGYAPSPYAVNFAEGYDRVSYQLLRLRFGKNFDAEVRRQAAADVYEHEVVIEGCYWPSNQLVTAAHDEVSIAGSDQILRGLEAARKKTVRLRGKMLDIRGSNWRRAGRPELRVEAAEILGASCSQRP